MRRLLLGAAAALTLGVAAAPSAAQAPAPTIDPDTPLTVYVGLARPEAAARAAWTRVGDPASASYRRFASLGEIARRYGATPRTIARFRAAARALGLRAAVDPSGVFARVSAPAGRMQSVFRVAFRVQYSNDVFANTYFLPPRGRLHLPASLRPYVREVVTTSARSAPLPPAGQSAQAVVARPRNLGTWQEGCRGARAVGAYSFAQVRTAYGLDAVGTGAGARLGVFNLGESAPLADVRQDEACFGLPRIRPRTILTDGQSAPFGRGSQEPQEDVALIRGMAPGARSLTFVQAWAANDLWFLGFAEALSAAPRPDVLSVSYGQCERYMTGPGAPLSARAGSALGEALLVRLGLVGTSALASAGDFGSTCNGQAYRGAAWPASSPYLTAVGGTRLVLDAENRRVDEVVWNDLPWLNPNNGGGVGGGGASLFSPRPAYQERLPVAGRHRLLPDVAAHASMLPGWPVPFAGTFVEDGGTSASAPLVAGAVAAIVAAERAAGRPPLGPLNGLLYLLRDDDPGAFWDVVSGQNRYAPRVPGFRALPGYDRASGLGVPRFDRLAAALPRPG